MEGENSVYVDKDRPNSARHRLFINPDSEIRAALSDLVKVKQAFFGVISRIKNVSDTIENWGKDDYGLESMRHTWQVDNSLTITKLCDNHYSMPKLQR